MAERNEAKFFITMQDDATGKLKKASAEFVAMAAQMGIAAKTAGGGVVMNLNQAGKATNEFGRHLRNSGATADKFAMRYNRIQKQFDNYDCGVFSEVFITQMLKNISFDEICKRMKSDRDINKLRDVLYTPSKVSKI